MPTERNRKVRERAYGLWVAGGHQDGRSDEHWAQAEREIDAEERPAELKTSAAVKAAAGGAAPEKAPARPAVPAGAVKPAASAKARAPKKRQSTAAHGRGAAPRDNGSGAAKH